MKQRKTWAERKAAGWVPPPRRGGWHNADYVRPTPSPRSRAPKSTYLDRPAIFWDGEGVTSQPQIGVRREFRDSIEQLARAELATYETVYAPFWDAFAELGPIERRANAPAYEYAGIPAKVLAPARSHDSLGTADLHAQVVESISGVPIDSEGLLEMWRAFRSRPTLKAMRADLEERHAHRAPHPGRHDYVLLACSTGAYLEDYTGIGTRAALDFLLATAEKHPRAVHVGFALAYDFDMMLGDLERRDMMRLRAASKGGIRIQIGGRVYRITYRPRKFLRVSDNHGRTITLYDAFGFFQTTFVRACADWLDDRKKAALRLDDIHEMKLRRSQFTAADRDAVRQYCFLELEAGVALIDELRERVRETKIPLQSLDGAGAIARGIYTMHGVKASVEEDPESHRVAIARAYFGGRIEMMGLGFHDAAMYEYDVRSAYPAAIAKLPDLAGATWHEGKQSPWYFVDLEWHLPTIDRDGATIPFFPLPYRLPNDGVIFPSDGRCTVWMHELEAARLWCDRFGGDLIEHRAVSIVPVDSSRRPFAFVPDLYDTRSQWKRDGRGAEKVLKLGLNSLYGKMAQQVGAIVLRDRAGNVRLKPPPYFSLAWAGMVTSATRAQLVTAALCDPYAAMMFMTDGLYMQRDLAIDLGPGLGQWEEARWDGIVVAQPGVYWKRDGTKWIPKVRGFNRETLLTPDAVLEAWRTGVDSLVIPTTRFVTAGTASTSPEAWRAWRTWQTEPRELSLQGDSLKRLGLRSSGRSRRPDRAFVPLAPQVNHLPGEISKPYDVAFWRGARVERDTSRAIQDEIDMLDE